MRVRIENTRYSSVLYNGKFYDTRVDFDVPFSDALRLRLDYSLNADFKMVPYNAELWKNKTYVFQGQVDGTSGWGNVSANLMKFSSRAGYDPRWLGKTFDNLDREVLRLGRKEITSDMPVVIHEQPKDDWFSTPFARKIVVVPFETTRIPSSWVGRINFMDGLLVPCAQNVQMMRDSGVKIPIEVVHWGIDEKMFYPLERNNEFFTFGCMGALSKRKGVDILLEAFARAFPYESDVRMIMKSSYFYYPFNVKDPRIKVMLTPVSHENLMQDFFSKIDCFVFPSHGEGFGLPPLEAMATGVPAIVTGWSGLTEFVNNEVGWLIDHTMIPAEDFTKSVYKEDCGDWAEPSVNDLIDKLRYAYSHWAEVKEKGRKAAEFVQREWLWSQKIETFHRGLSKML